MHRAHGASAEESSATHVKKGIGAGRLPDCPQVFLAGVQYQSVPALLSHTHADTTRHPLHLLAKRRMCWHYGLFEGYSRLASTRIERPCLPPSYVSQHVHADIIQRACQHDAMASTWAAGQKAATQALSIKSSKRQLAHPTLRKQCSGKQTDLQALPCATTTSPRWGPEHTVCESYM